MPSKRTLIFVSSAAICAGFVYWKKDAMREYASSLCEWMSLSPDNAVDLVRNTFTDTQVVPVVPIPGHTHAQAAGARTAATSTARTIAMKMGVELYVEGMSRSDQRKGLRGSRQWYWPKDVHTSNRNDEHRECDLKYMCDVDYFYDMPKYLANNTQPLLMYTMVPETAASSSEDDTAFYFDSEGVLHTFVAGGGKYNHPIWDYSKDSVKIMSYWLGIPWKCVVYAIERKQVTTHRQLVLLAPIKYWYVGACLADFLLEEKPLTRLRPIVNTDDGKFVRMKVVRPDGEVYVSTARPQSFLCCTVSAQADEAVASVSRLGSSKLQLSTVQSWVDDRMQAVVLTEYHRTTNKCDPPFVYPVGKSVRAYTYDKKQWTAEERPKMKAFMSPLIHGAFTPYVCKASEERCVEARINRLKKEEPRYNAFRDRCMEEFARLVCMGTTLHPKAIEFVESKQTRPAQRMSLAKAFLTGPFRKRVLKCFQKAEAYANVKDPRNITTYNDADKLDMATFALALSEHCKQFPWYGPGKTPKEIANRVAEICSKASFVNVSDYHRMDGTISYTIRNVERFVCMKSFPDYRVQLNELLNNNVDNKGYLPFGTTFDQGSSHGSGCSATSLFQTLRATFTSYLAYRKTKRNGCYYTPEEAFKALGIHLGDDGLDADLDTDTHEWASNSVGLILEANVIQRGFRGVNFLARYYSTDVWNGCPNSMCDVKRQLAKFHVTIRLPENVPAENKLVEKAMSFVATDPNTPVIGPLCRKVLLLSTFRPRRLLDVGTWWGKFSESEQYPNENVDGWMDVEFGEQLPRFDRQLFDNWLDSVVEPAQLLEPPLCQPIEPPTIPDVAVIVDDMVFEPQETEDCPSEASAATSRASRTKKKRVARRKGTRNTKRDDGEKPLKRSVRTTRAG